MGLTLPQGGVHAQSPHTVTAPARPVQIRAHHHIDVYIDINNYMIQKLGFILKSVCIKNFKLILCHSSSQEHLKPSISSLRQPSWLTAFYLKNSTGLFPFHKISWFNGPIKITQRNMRLCLLFKHKLLFYMAIYTRILNVYWCQLNPPLNLPKFSECK